MTIIEAIDAYIAALHPYLAGVDTVQLLSVAVVSWLGAHGITRGEMRRR